MTSGIRLHVIINISNDYLESSSIYSEVLTCLKFNSRLYNFHLEPKAELFRLQNLFLTIFFKRLQPQPGIYFLFITYKITRKSYRIPSRKLFNTIRNAYGFLLQRATIEEPKFIVKSKRRFSIKNPVVIKEHSNSNIAYCVQELVLFSMFVFQVFLC